MRAAECHNLPVEVVDLHRRQAPIETLPGGTAATRIAGDFGDTEVAAAGGIRLPQVHRLNTGSPIRAFA